MLDERVARGAADDAAEVRAVAAAGVGRSVDIARPVRTPAPNSNAPARDPPSVAQSTIIATPKFSSSTGAGIVAVSRFADGCAIVTPGVVAAVGAWAESLPARTSGPAGAFVACDALATGGARRAFSSAASDALSLSRSGSCNAMGARTGASGVACAPPLAPAVNTMPTATAVQRHANARRPIIEAPPVAPVDPLSIADPARPAAPPRRRAPAG